MLLDAFSNSRSCLIILFEIIQVFVLLVTSLLGIAVNKFTLEKFITNPIFFLNHFFKILFVVIISLD